jgi:hypothetical protein
MISQIRQGYKTILMPFTPANMDLFALSVNIADLQCQCFTQAQSH